jgi:hypothetical protein
MLADTNVRHRSLSRTGVIDIGRKSENVFGSETYETGVTIAVNQIEGTMPERIE